MFFDWDDIRVKKKNIELAHGVHKKSVEKERINGAHNCDIISNQLKPWTQKNLGALNFKCNQLCTIGQ